MAVIGIVFFRAAGDSTGPRAGPTSRGFQAGLIYLGLTVVATIGALIVGARPRSRRTA